MSARDQASGREQSITVRTTGTLSEQEIEQLVQEHAEYDLPDEA